MLYRYWLVMLLAGCGPAGPPAGATEGTEAQVLAFRSGIEAGCKSTGRDRGDPPDQVEAFCGCVMAELDIAMSPRQWRVAVIATMEQDNGKAKFLQTHKSAFLSCAKRYAAQ